jgi:hypothetical protein
MPNDSPAYFTSNPTASFFRLCGNRCNCMNDSQKRSPKPRTPIDSRFLYTLHAYVESVLAFQGSCMLNDSAEGFHWPCAGVLFWALLWQDVGYSVLESYSRALVNLGARIETRIVEVLSADKDAILSRLHSVNANSDPLTSPGAPCSVETQGPSTSTTTTATVTNTRENLVHLGMQHEEVLWHSCWSTVECLSCCCC